MPEAGDAAGASRSRRLTAGLLVAATGVVVAAVYLAVSPTDKSSSVPVPEPGLSRAQKTRQAIEAVIARADSINAADGARALATRRKGYEAACAIARKFIQLEDRTDIVVRPLLAKALVRLDRFDDAEKVVDQLLKLAPGSTEGLLMKGQLLSLRDRDAALAYFRRAAESADAIPQIWARYGGELLARKEVAEAERYLTKAYEAGWKDHQTLLSLAAIAMQTNRFEKAEKYVTELVATGRGNVRILTMLAEAQKQAGKAAEAEKTLRKALGLEPSPELRLQLADVLVLLRRRDEAARMFAKAAEDSSLGPEAAYKAARLYYILDEYALAMKYIDRAAEYGLTPQVAQWRTKIENARFGEPDSTPRPSLLLPPTGPPPGPTGAGSGAATRPATLLPPVPGGE